MYTAFDQKGQAENARNYQNIAYAKRFADASIAGPMQRSIASFQPKSI
jgi:hypothetical protein